MPIAKASDGSPVYAPVRPSLALFAMLGAVVGAAFIAFITTGSVKAAGVSYTDLAAVLLTAVAVIVAIFGAVVAVAAFWGFQQMKLEAVRTATSAALEETREQIENGTIRNYITEEVEARIAAIVASPEFERRVEARVDKIALGNPEDRYLETGEDGEQQ